MKKYQGRKYTVVEYDPNWKKQFEAESKFIKDVLESIALEIEHVGSSSVVGMAGKPTIDILVIVDDITQFEKHVGDFEDSGYIYQGAYIDEAGRQLAKKDNGNTMVQIHVFPKDNTRARAMLKFRDSLIASPELIREYSELKTDLYKKFPEDYGKYREYKDPYLEKLLKRLIIKGENNE